MLLFLTVTGETQTREESSTLTMCVTSSMADSCSHLNKSNITITNLSELSQVLTVRGKGIRNIVFYLTGGTHILNDTFEMKKTQNVRIIGEKNIRPSVVLCHGNGGILFEFEGIKNQSHFYMSDLVLDNCKHKRGTDEAGLILVDVSYLLERVTITNSTCHGMYARRCKNQTIENCTFQNNAGSHLKIDFDRENKNINAIVSICNTIFRNGNAGGKPGIYVKPSQYVSLSLSIHLSTFAKNTGHFWFDRNTKLNSHTNDNVYISESTFTKATNERSGIRVDSADVRNQISVQIKRSNFTDNGNTAIYLSQIKDIFINECNIANSKTGLYIHKEATDRIGSSDAMVIVNKTNFYTTARALVLLLHVPDHRTIVGNCTFRNNDADKFASVLEKEVVLVEGRVPSSHQHNTRSNTVTIADSKFEKNYGNKQKNNCTILLVNFIDELVVESSSITDNNCTGLSLSGSSMMISKELNVSRNSGVLGGGIRLQHRAIPSDDILTSSLKNSVIELLQHSRLYMFNNTASIHGGGIYTDTDCGVNTSCFFQLKEVALDEFFLTFEGNRAVIAGDAIFGGCLSECLLNAKSSFVNVTDLDNTFWKVVQITDNKSSSLFAEYPSRVAFCSNKTSNTTLYPTSCSNGHSVSAYRGERFHIELMIVDDSCFASTGIINAQIAPLQNKKVRLDDAYVYKHANKYCDVHDYILTGTSDIDSIVTMEFYINSDRQVNSPPATLEVHFMDCPSGFEFSTAEENCICADLVKQVGIECTPSDHTFTVPALIWMGEVKGKLVVHRSCKRCRTEGKQTLKNTSNSDILCPSNRTGVLCGACERPTSLKLGGYKCGNCMNSAYQGTLLILLFAFIGIILVLVLVKLNLTVSTGLINGLIFYSNIVYSNSDDFILTSQDTNSTHLNSAVEFLYTFQAWINLDFGINTCFFHGYDEYIATWMQFVFPFYLWTLIFVIVIASKYSSNLSKFTGFNTIPALATLLLLSYSKLLTTSIAASSYTKIAYLKDNTSDLVWIQDPNIDYLKGKHIPLFMSSLLVGFLYIIPFTLLLTSGPILQAQSQYKVFQHINRIKPFLDAFYGPYTKTYRYWPGILLITRLILLNVFAYYSLGERNYKLACIAVITTLLFILWWLMGKTDSISLHRNRKLNYLEMFFLWNLITYSCLTLYFSCQQATSIYKQQVMTVALLGSVFFVSCGIVLYRIVCMIKSWKTTNKLIQILHAKYYGKICHFSTLFHMNRCFKLAQDQDAEDVTERAEIGSSSYVSDVNSFETHSEIQLREPLIQN